MKNYYQTILFFLCVNAITSAQAAIIQPGMTDDFEDGTTASWVKGSSPAKNASSLPPVNIANDDDSNRFLHVTSIGGSPGESSREAHSRLVFFNEQQWTGDFSQISAISLRLKAESASETELYMRLAVYDDKSSGSYSRYVSSDSQTVKTDGLWHTIVLSLLPDDLTRFRGERSAQDVLSSVTHLRLLSNKDEATAWMVDKIAATVSIDDITAIGFATAPVPVPAAAWVFISALGMTLAGRKRKPS